MELVRRTISGRYVLVVVKPRGTRGDHQIDSRARRPEGLRLREAVLPGLILGLGLDCVLLSFGFLAAFLDPLSQPEYTIKA